MSVQAIVIDIYWFIGERSTFTSSCQPLHSRTRSRMNLDLWPQNNNITPPPPIHAPTLAIHPLKINQVLHCFKLVTRFIPEGEGWVVCMVKLPLLFRDCRILGTGHYLWPGGGEEKWGDYEDILMCREWVSKKNWEARSGHQNISFPKISPLAWRLLYFLIICIVFSKSGCRKMFWLHAEWALKTFLAKCKFRPPSPGHK